MPDPELGKATAEHSSLINALLGFGTAAAGALGLQLRRKGALAHIRETMGKLEINQNANSTRIAAIEAGMATKDDLIDAVGQITLRIDGFFTGRPASRPKRRKKGKI